MQLQVREEQQLQELRNRQALEAAQQQAREKERDRQSIIHELVRGLLARCGMCLVVSCCRWCLRDQPERCWPATVPSQRDLLLAPSNVI